MKPLSKPTPSVISSSVFSVDDSSTDTTPSWPTLVIASPTSSPICSSREETVATCAMPFLSETGVAEASSASDTASAAKRHPHCVGELVYAGFQCAARSFVELNLLAHICLSL